MLTKTSKNEQQKFNASKTHHLPSIIEGNKKQFCDDDPSMLTNANKNEQVKMVKKKVCKMCNYETERNSNWYRHIKTNKHLSNMRCKRKTQQPSVIYTCEKCKKIYLHPSSLSRHKKTCLVDQEKTLDNLKNIIINISNKNTIVNNININILLETRCKGAMNITDFIDNLQLSMDDLFYTKKNGYVEGMSNIFIKHLKVLNPTERPIHCSNNKDKDMYIKDHDRWEIDKAGGILSAQINTVTKKHLDTLKLWENITPNWHSSEKHTRMYMDFILNIIGKTDATVVYKQIQKFIGDHVKIEDVYNNTINPM